MEGHLDFAVLQASLDEIVRRHETLRTAIGSKLGKPCQIVFPPGPFPLACMELSAHPEADAEAERLANCEARAPFSLTQESLARVDLFRTAAEKHLLVVNIHHLVADGWSIGVFMRDLAHFYKMHTIGHTPPLPKLPIQYGDFALWQRELPQSSRWRENMD
ncbi:MAG: condensation domain-containing protein, partial [Limisphaerales bacterium]